MATDHISDSHFNRRLQQKRRLVNRILTDLLAGRTDINGELRQAMAYTLHAPGKRIRAAMLLWSCELAGRQVNRNAEMAAAAVEMLHTYSLVHDDLPAMDNDDLRRGRPTCHKAFSEATAILTGDALLTLAFEVLAREVDEPTVAVRLITVLAEAAGPAGMIAGQMADLKAEKTQANEEILESLHTNKTAKMFRAAAAMGAICGRAGEKDYQCLAEYGLKVGLGFQIADDILDVCGSKKHLGKTAGKDAKAGKVTYPQLFGINKSRQMAKSLARQAVTLLEPFGERAETLRQMAMVLLRRTR